MVQVTLSSAYLRNRKKEKNGPRTRHLGRDARSESGAAVVKNPGWKGEEASGGFDCVTESCHGGRFDRGLTDKCRERRPLEPP